jgi:hypothetical protein
MTDQKNISFRIKNISTLQFSIKNIPELDVVDKSLIHFQINPASFADKDNDVIGIDTLVDVYLDQENQIKVCELITRITYEVVNFSEFIDPSDNSINIPDQIMHTFLSISLSTTRGILAAKTEGTQLRDVFIPILNPTGFKPVEVNKTT